MNCIIYRYEMSNLRVSDELKRIPFPPWQIGVISWILTCWINDPNLASGNLPPGTSSLHEETHQLKSLRAPNSNFYTSTYSKNSPNEQMCGRSKTLSACTPPCPKASLTFGLGRSERKGTVPTLSGEGVQQTSSPKPGTQTDKKSAKSAHPDPPAIDRTCQPSTAEYTAFPSASARRGHILGHTTNLISLKAFGLHKLCAITNPSRKAQKERVHTDSSSRLVLSWRQSYVKTWQEKIPVPLTNADANIIHICTFI